MMLSSHGESASSLDFQITPKLMIQFCIPLNLFSHSVQRARGKSAPSSAIAFLHDNNVEV
jgi:hypothetical protein